MNGSIASNHDICKIHVAQVREYRDFYRWDMLIQEADAMCEDDA